MICPGSRILAPVQREHSLNENIIDDPIDNTYTFNHVFLLAVASIRFSRLLPGIRKEK